MATSPTIRIAEHLRHFRDKTVRLTGKVESWEDREK
jgi:hypothetical protein